MENKFKESWKFKVFAKATSDVAFRDALISNPAEAIAKLGYSISASEIEAVKILMAVEQENQAVSDFTESTLKNLGGNTGDSQ